MLQNQKAQALREELIAAVALADGRYLKVEDEKAKSILQMHDGGENISAQFEELLTAMKEKMSFPAIDHDHTQLPTSAKIDLVSICWEIAMCDGELHPSEEILIYHVIDQLKLLRRDAVLAQQQAMGS